MKKWIFILLLQVAAFNTFAHVGGHGTPTKTWRLSQGNIEANFVKQEGNLVYLSDSHNNTLTFDINEFTKEDRQFIEEKAQWILKANTASHHHYKGYGYLLIFFGAVLLLVSVFKWGKRYKRFQLAYGIIGLALIVVGCKNTSGKEKSAITDIKLPANDVSFLESVFGAFDKVTTRYDDHYFYVESDGIPEHGMMTGITNWQQQVPIDHDYSGNNAWAIPLQPELAETPLSTKTNFMKGAIAIAANGLPIFNPLNNRGEDANAIGELDKWGGHCGRADDYHYHLPPTHLQEQVGEGKPIAYALDGFPVYGETDEKLDESLGRFNEEGSYEYHSVNEYPYLIASMRGKVKLNPRTKAPENEIMPQAKTKGVRPDLRPLKDAVITGFKTLGPNSYSLTYAIGPREYTINYGWNEEDEYTFEFVDPDGESTVSTYERKK